MWKVLTPEEKIRVQARNKRKAIKDSLFVSLFIFVFAILMDKYFGGGRQEYDPNLLSETYPPKTWGEIASDIDMYLIVSIFIGLLVYYLSPFEKNTTRICIKCGNRDQEKHPVQCRCGETLYNLDDLEWIE